MLDRRHGYVVLSSLIVGLFLIAQSSAAVEQDRFYPFELERLFHTLQVGDSREQALAGFRASHLSVTDLGYGVELLWKGPDLFGKGRQDVMASLTVFWEDNKIDCIHFNFPSNQIFEYRGDCVKYLFSGPG